MRRELLRRPNRVIATIGVCATLGAVGVVAAQAEGTAPSFASLRARVQGTVLSIPETTTEGPPLVIGARYAEQLFVMTTVPNAAMPNTIDANFQHWLLAARASLLLDYARMRSASDVSRPYRGVPQGEIDAMQLRDREAWERAQRVGAAGGYEQEWAPVVAAYRQVLDAVEAVLGPGDTAPNTLGEVSLRVDRIAREKGRYKLIYTVRVDPADAASEMLRLVSGAMGEKGVEGEVTDRGPTLLYACADPVDGATATEGTPHVSIRVHAWHRHSPAAFRAWATVGRGTADAEAESIVQTFRTLEVDINTWLHSNPRASSADVDRRLNEMANSVGLVSMLAQYGNAPAAGQGSSSSGSRIQD